MMKRLVIKRNGAYVKFEAHKVRTAIEKAYASVSRSPDTEVIEGLLKQLETTDIMVVEDIQDRIEKALYTAGHFEVMRSFMRYRHTRKMQREHTCGLREYTTYVDSSQTIAEYIEETDWRIQANANTSYSNAGLVNNVAGKLIANYWLDEVYSEEEGQSHRNGDLHIHDLDCLTGYCAGWSLRVLLNEGFNGVRGRVESRPPHHFREALGQMANFLGILQSEWAGAQAFSSFDTYLAPYVFKDRLDYESVRKAIRSFVYNLNVPARWGQSPFTNITLDWVVPEDLSMQTPMRGDRHLFEGDEHEALRIRAKARGAERPTDLQYRHFLEEMQMINKAYYQVMTEGDAGGQPFTFPIPMVNITEDFDWYGENTDLLFENTARMGTSYFQNFIGSQYLTDQNGNKVRNPEAYQPNAVRSMCCRLQLDLRELLKRGNGLFGSAEMTGSIGVVTINMARLGYLYPGRKKQCYRALDRLLRIASSTLEKKRVFIQEMYDRGLYPYTRRYLQHFRNHFSTIGVNGINEMVRNYTGDQYDLTTTYGHTMASEVLEYIRKRLQEFQEATGNLYNLEATPAEGTTYRFAREDVKRFPDILQAGTPENPYYTNSSQLPVDFTDDPFEALLMQDGLQCKYTGGTVLHLYMKEKISSPEACRQFVKTVLTNFRLPYITVTPVFSICPVHGYLDGAYEFCPICDEELEAAREKREYAVKK
ncbi:ribonucleoside-triphosphate reductase class III catalytic subunit [Sinomicrobium oceani]|uniref:Ribonucleoside-triphosphate reductase class III catalytic subunit n=1 Tax=Sinomicrobium oceani TaxID=1150368 RepID=A0A1K1RTZ5_9FLAO|nr:ribonucleoside triphosphate reductase [Sinomicrobium oceani]SFW75715.1 ribonucleoside-triphosphate reductase class III catalytic subunit [Sinomicrobium oceani]